MYEISRSNLATFPYTAVGAIITRWADGSQSVGTCTMVGPNDILTAGHCVYSPTNGGWAVNFDFYFGADWNTTDWVLESSSLNLSTGKNLRWQALAWPAEVYQDQYHNLVTYSESQFDIALIGLSESPGNQTGWFGMDPGYDSYALKSFYQLGYPNGSRGLMFDTASVYKSYFYDVYNANGAGMGPGSSGGPLYTSDYTVIGVKSGGSVYSSTWADLGGKKWNSIYNFYYDNDSLIKKQPVYTLSADARAVDEGSSIQITVKGENVSLGSDVSYSITGISQSDLNAGALSGKLNFNGSKIASLKLDIKNDRLTEGTETLRFEVGTASIDIAINDTSRSPPSVLITSDKSKVNEGGVVNFQVSTKNIDPGVALDYLISGIQENDIRIPVSGKIEVGSDGIAILSVRTVADMASEGDETLKLKVVDPISQTYSVSEIEILDTSSSIKAPASPSNSSEALWIKTGGASGFDGIQGLVKTNGGLIYASGYTTEGGVAKTSAARGQIIQLDQDGTENWKYVFGSKELFHTTKSMSPLTNGELCFMSYAYGGDLILSKLSLEGNLQWSYNMAPLSGSNVYVVSDQNDFIYISASDQYQNHLYKFSNDGTLLWSKQYFIGNSYKISWGIDIDPAGNLVTLTSVGSNSYLHTLDSNGNVLKEIRLDIPFNEFDIASDGSIYLARGVGVGFGQSVYGAQDVRLTKIDPAGGQVWTKFWGGKGEEWPIGLAVTLDNGVIVVGTSSSSDISGVNTFGKGDAFAVEYSSDGSALWTRFFGSEQDDRAESMVFGDDGSVILGGYGAGAMPGFSYADTPGSYHDYFITKLQGRVVKTNKIVDYDLSGHAGETARILGALFGPESVSNEVYVGIGIRLLQGGLSARQVIQIGIDFLDLETDEQLVRSLWKNVVGSEALSSDVRPFLSMLESGVIDETGLVELAANSDINLANIDLVGLAQFGLEYI